MADRPQGQPWFTSELVEALPTAVYICDADAVIVACNRRATELWGRTPKLGDTDEKFCGSHRLFRPDGTYLPHRETPMEYVLRTGNAARDQEVIIEHPDGSRVTVLVNIAPLFDPSGAQIGAVNCFQDLTAQKQAEKERAQLRDELLQAQKMDALGRLTGGLAHDFNNLLSAIAGNLELLERRLSDPAALRILASASEAAARGARLTTQILAFARRQDLTPQAIDLNEIIVTMAETLARTLGGAIAIEVRRANDLWPAWADPTQFELAIMNLALNARDAMPSGGTITIATENVAAERLDRGLGLPPGDYVRASVTDTGGGISEEVLAHVFEPYFTTKEMGKGTGLGLSMAQGMAAQFGGKATIESRVGDGTSVNIILSRAPAPAAHVQSAEGMPAATGSGRILVVDDDAGVRSFLTDALVDLGYEAIVASDFADALSIVQGGEPLDAVLSDFKMPGMSGSDLLARLQEIRPGLKGLLITGNTEAVDKRDVSFPVLGKPFKLAVLADHLRTLLTPAEQGRRL